MVAQAFACIGGFLAPKNKKGPPKQELVLASVAYVNGVGAALANFGYYLAFIIIYIKRASLPH